MARARPEGCTPDPGGTMFHWFVSRLRISQPSGIPSGRHQLGVSMADANERQHWHTRTRVALRSALFAVASVAASIILGTFSVVAALIALPSALLAVVILEMIAWWRRRPSS